MSLKNCCIRNKKVINFTTLSINRFYTENFSPKLITNSFTRLRLPDLIRSIIKQLIWAIRIIASLRCRQARMRDTRFITHYLHLFPRGIMQSLRVRAGMQARCNMQPVINIAASRARPGCRGLPCILKRLIQLYRLSTTTANTLNEIRSE